MVKARLIYIPESFIQVWNTYASLCSDNQTSISAELRLYISREVELWDGNRQTRLDRHLEPVLTECYGCKQKFTKANLKRVLWVSGLESLMCPACIEAEYKKRGNSILKRVYGVSKK
jgi:hypothetical protein